MSKTPWGELGYITFKRTYARRLKEDDPNSKTEEFTDTVERVIKACRTQLDCGFTQEEEEQVRDMMLNLRGSVAGRFLWQLGTKTVARLGLLSLQNCAFTTVNTTRAFTWAMDALMLGSGVGFNIQKENVHQLPKPKKAKITRQDTKDADFIVPDSREGWIKLLEEVLRAHFETGKDLSYSTVLIRSKGALIQGFGGLASGPEELCQGIADISKILNSRAGKRLRPIDALDMMNIIGKIVVAGNVRRSAELSAGDMDDLQYLNSKRWDLGPIPNYRSMSNNSVVCNDIKMLPTQFWTGFDGNGEAFGLINLKLSRKIGRIIDGNKYPDPDVDGYNPCAEQSLADKETCCLAETFLPNIRSKEELIMVIKLLYRINKHSLRLKCHLEETEAIVHKHMRMGIGITGYLQATEEQRSWLSDAYMELRKYDVEYSKKMGWPTSIKLTTVKPSGTLSLLAGVTPGVHPAYSLFWIRRIRISASSPLAALCRKHGYFSEFQKNFDGTEDKSTVVVSFPCKVPPGTILAKDCTAVQQLEYVKRLQTEWSDNAVSCTVYYRKEELQSIKDWLLANYNDNVKSVSFLLHSEHGFKQAPYEEITEEQYKEYSALVTPIEHGDVDENDMLDTMECVGGVCPIK